MSRSHLHLIAPLALAAAFVLWGPSGADAAFQVTFGVTSSGSTTTQTVTDGGAGDTDGFANSIIVVSQTVNGYQFQVTLATTNTPGGPAISFVNTDTALIRDVPGGAGANATVFVRVSANNFTSPVTPPPLNAFSSATAQYKAPTPPGSTATVSYSAWVDASNAIDGMATLVGSDSDTITQPGDPSAALSDSSKIASLGSPYTLTFQVMAAFGRSGQAVDLDGQLFLTPVPEPGTLAAAVTALPLLAGLYLRRRRARRAA